MEITRETVNYTSEEEWLENRRRDITSTECAGLFDEGVYENARTFYELFQIKSGTLPPAPFEMNERVKWGTRLEAAIAAGMAEDLGLVIEPFKVYMRIPELRMGSSFDFKIVGIDPLWRGDDSTARDMFIKHGEGILEIKNVDGLQFRRGWIDDGEVVEAPAHIELQVAHQFEVSGLAWAVIAPLVGGNTPKTIYRERDESIGTAIRLKAAEFWTYVSAGVAPSPNFGKDKSTIARLLLNDDGSEINMQGNQRFSELCMASKFASDQIKASEAEKDAATAELLMMIGAAKRAVGDNGFSVSASTIAPTTVSYERSGYRRVVVNRKKGS